MIAECTNDKCRKHVLLSGNKGVCDACKRVIIWNDKDWQCVDKVLNKWAKKIVVRMGGVKDPHAVQKMTDNKKVMHIMNALMKGAKISFSPEREICIEKSPDGKYLISYINTSGDVESFPEMGFNSVIEAILELSDDEAIKISQKASWIK